MLLFAAQKGRNMSEVVAGSAAFIKGVWHSLSSHQRVKERLRATAICYCVCLPTPVPGGFEVRFENCI